MRAVALILIVLALLLAGCSSPGASVNPPSVVASDPADGVQRETVTGSTGAVGGSVANSAPVVQAFTPSATTGENRGGFVVVFTGRVFDRNTESQVQNLSVVGVGPTLLAAGHAVTAEERNATTAPAEFGSDGFKVWTGTKNDGILNFEFRRTFPAFTPAGAYAFTAYVADAPGLLGASAPVAITLAAFSDITIGPTPVDAAGVALAGQNWGHWSAEAGASNVASNNYIKLENTGDVAASSVVIDLANEFVGVEDSSFTIPTAGNIQFAWAQGPVGAIPSALTFNYLPANADGTVTVQFAGQGNVLYVTYRIVQLPDVLPVQSYGISFTVTEL